MQVRRRFVRLGWCLGLAAALLGAGGVTAQTSTDARVKARLVITLARFTQWPATAFATPTDALQLCVLQHDEAIAEAFAELGGQTVAGRVIKVLPKPDKALLGCDVLFVHDSAERAVASSLAAVAGLPVLTVGDADGYAARGGMVEMVNVNDAIQLDVNLKAVRAAHLGLSSQVLKLARQVRE